MRRTLAVLRLACLILGVAGLELVNAQDYRAKVQGVITDSSQAAVVSAQVTLRNHETGVGTANQSNETGKYLFDYVEPGTYTLTVEFTACSKALQDNLFVRAAVDVR